MGDAEGWLPSALRQAGVYARKKEGQKRVISACAQCKAGKVKCDSDRPCRRCLYRGIGEQCVDVDDASTGADADRPLAAASGTVPVLPTGSPTRPRSLGARAAHGTLGAKAHDTAETLHVLEVATASMQVLGLSAALAARYCHASFLGPVGTSLHLWLHDTDVLRVTELVTAGAVGDRLSGVRMIVFHSFCAELLACCLDLASLHDGRARLTITWEDTMQKGARVLGVDERNSAELALLRPRALARIDRYLNQVLSIDELQSSHSMYDYALTVRRVYESAGCRQTVINDVLSSTSSEAREQSWYEMLYAPLHHGLNASSRVVSRYLELKIVRVPGGSGVDVLTVHVYVRARLPQFLGGWRSGWRLYGSFPAAKPIFVGRGGDANDWREWACFMPIVDSSKDAAKEVFKEAFEFLVYKGYGKPGHDMLPLFVVLLSVSDSGMCMKGCFEVVAPARRHKDKSRDGKRDASDTLLEPRATCQFFRMIFARKACG